jgi:outer membrane autotransporter protein
VNGGRINIENNGQFNGTDLLLINGGVVTVRSGANGDFSGPATVDPSSRLRVLFDGEFEAPSLGAGGAVIAEGTNAVIDVANAINVGGFLQALDGGEITGDTLRVRNGGEAGATGAGSTLTVAGAVDIQGGTLFAETGGVVFADSIDQTTGVLNPRAGGVISSTNAITVSGGQALIDGTLDAQAGLQMTGGLLSGAGLIDGDVQLSGTLAPGGVGRRSIGILNVDGNFTDDSAVYNFDFVPTPTPTAGTDHDQLLVSGDATIDGGNVNVLVPEDAPFSRFTEGARYTIVDAGGTVNVTAPVTVNDPFLSTTFGTEVVGNNFNVVVIEVVSFGDIGNTFNTRQVGGALETVFDDPNDELGRLLDSLDRLPSEAAQVEAFNQLSGELFGSQMTNLNRSSLQFLDRIDGRDAADPLACGNCGGQAAFGLTGWTNTYGGEGRVDGDGNAFEAETGAVGMIVGLEQAFGGNGGACLTLGSFFGSEILSTEVPLANSKVNDEVYRVGGYAKATVGRAYGRLTAFGGLANGESRRAVAIDASRPFGDATYADTDTGLGAFGLEGGYLFGVPGAYLMPIAGVRYVGANRDGFTETGGLTALSVQGGEQEETRLRIGARAGREVLITPLAPTTLTLDAFYSWDLDDGAVGEFAARFANAPDATFLARGTDFGQDRFIFGPGLTIGDGPVRFAGQYRVEATNSAVFHAGNAGLEVCF